MNWYRLSQMKQPWEMTQEEFLEYHYTGYISTDAYENYRTVEGLNWIKKEKYHLLYSVKKFSDKEIEFRKSDDKLKYVKHDENYEIARGADGMALYLSRDEMIERDLPLTDTSIVAFDGDVAVGFVSNEFGADGVWVVDDYQKMGIGTYLLYEFRKQFKSERKIGQMTYQGKAMSRSLHKRYVEEALLSGNTVPAEVLEDYPDLKYNYIEGLK